MDRLAQRIAKLSPEKRKLLDRLLAREGVDARQGPILPRPAGMTVVPLSFAQQRLWVLHQLDPTSPLYNVAYILRFRGRIDGASLRRAHLELVRRHEILRTTFPVVDSHPVQRIAPPPDEVPPAGEIDLTGLPLPECEARLEKLAAAEALRPFDLARGPLHRETWVRMSEEDHAGLFTLHHLLTDGWSQRLYLQELVALYEAFARGERPPLPPLPVQYADYALWQRERLQGARLDGLLAYWKGRLAGLRPLELPGDRPRPAAVSLAGGRVGVDLEPALVESLRRWSRAQGATPFMTLLAAFGVLLHRLSGQDDLAIGSPVANRDRPEVERVIGFFVNMLVLRIDLSGIPTFRELLRRVRQMALEAYEHQEMPLEKLVEALQPTRDPARHPLFQVVFALDKGTIRALKRPDLTLAVREIDTHTSRFDLMLALTEDNTSLHGHLEFRRDLFDEATVARWLRHFRVLLEAAITDPDRPISELPLLTVEESRQLLSWSRGEQVSIPAAPCLHHLFEEQAARAPDAVALTCEGASLTYGELNAWANRLARRLRDRGLGPGMRVGLFAERSAAMIAGVLGILKAGAAYVPIDTRYPDDRAAFLLADAAAPVVLTQRDLTSRLEGIDARLLFLEDDAAGECCANLPPAARPADPAYVIYTSGSTGRPKGVVVTHANVVRLFRATEGWMGCGPSDVWTLFHSIAFDFSVWELWGALLYGGRLVVVPYWVSRSPADFLALLARERVTVLNQTPSAFRQLMRAEEQTGPRELALRLVIFGGEALDFQGLRPWFERHGDRVPRLVNMYGITETTVHATYHPVTPADLGSGASLIGVPLPDLQVYVLDSKRQLCPVGVPGELYVGGAGVARGYLNRPALTAERFVPDPWSPDPSARLYRSGDRGRWRPDGRLEYLGRSDQQVKIRGFRIEPGEIEAQLSAHPAVRECVVVCREDVPSDRRLVAYVVGRDGAIPGTTELRAWLGMRLPEYMVPSAFVTLPALPLNANGKVDRAALPVPAGGRDALGSEYVAPRGPVEEALAAIWSSLLGIGRVGAEDNFFALGGNSLLAAQVVSRIREELSVEVPLRALFEAPTVAGLASAVDAAQESGLAMPAPPIEILPRPPGAPASFPLSFAQQRLWFLDQLQPGSPAYNIPAAVRLRGPLDQEALRRAFGEIVRRHESLRTTFAVSAVGDTGGPAQVIAPVLDLPLHVEDLSSLPFGEREAELLRKAEEEARRPFDLARGPLLRVSLLRLGDLDHAVLLTLHHIVGDAWSLGVLLREVALLYRAYREGNSSPLPELPVQYADFAAWQRNRLRGTLLTTQVAYWKERLAGVPPLDFPTDRPRPATPNSDGAQLSFTLPQLLAEGLRSLARREGATLYMALLAAFQALLHRCSGQEDFAVGSPIAGRNRKEVEGLIGFFVNTLVLRTDLSRDPSFRELLSRVRETCLGAYAHQDVPFETLVDELHPARDLSRSPLFQVVFSLQRVALPEVRVSGLSLEPLPADSGAVKFDLVLAMTDDESGLRGELKYRIELFDAATMQRLLGHFQTLLEGVVADPDRRLSALPFLSEAERRLVLDEWSGGRAVYPADACLHQLFEQQVRHTPDAVAVTFGRYNLTYAELNRRANHVAHRLRALGVGPETLVGVCLERSADLVVGLLGVLKAGGAYLPLDPAYPAERLAFLLRDAKVQVLLTPKAFAGASGLSDGAAPAVLFLDSGEAIGQETEEDVSSGVAPHHLAYVICTSGSTGQPKGVAVTHANVVRLLAATPDWFDFDGRDVWTLFHSFAFDFSVWELWGALLYGGRLVVVPTAVCRSPGDFLALLESERVTVLNQTPSAFRQLIRADAATPEPHPLALRLVIFGGEALELQNLKSWFDRRGDQVPRLVNMYGITETTVHVTYRPLRAIDVEQKRGSVIGVPIADLKVYVLDGKMQPAPVGVPGELYVGGPGLARGYLNRPALTAQRFVPDPFGEPGARLYRSGDRARWLPSGELEFLGRIDAQVKIRGFRIEPGEIETELARHPAVSECIVVAREDSAGDRSLAAYVVPRAGAAPSTADLRSHLRAKLPDYMIPAAFVVLDALPLTAHGKIDRQALPAPGPERPELGREYLAPRNDLERLLAERLAKVLGLDRVGVEDNFFELGGDSIKGALLINQLQQELQETVYVATLFDAPTVAGLAAYLEQQYPQAVARVLGRENHTASADDGPPVDEVQVARFRELVRIVRPLPPDHRLADRDTPKNRPVLFILSPPRSGSTLLRVLLAGHPRLFAPPELELLSFTTLAERRAAFSGRDRFWQEGALRAVMELCRCDAGQAAQVMASWEEQGWTTRRCYRQIQECLGERLLVDKTPSYALHGAVLRRAEEDFQEPLYIHLLRHPCGMIQSFEEVKLDQIFFRCEHPFSRARLAELIWLVSHQNILAFLQEVPARRHCRVRFEDLVQRPEPVLRALCAFLGLDFDPAMADPYRDSNRRMTDGPYAESRMLGDVKFHEYRSIDPAAADRWVGRLAEESLGGPTRELASSLGYAMTAHANGCNGFTTLRPQARAGDEAVARLDGLSDEEVEVLLREELAEEVADE